MNHDSLPIEGGCRCDRVRFRIGAPPLITMACHCRGCQRMTASAFSLSVAIPSSAFELTAGEPAIGGLHGPTRHFFCSWCMSWLFTRWEGSDAFVNVRATMLDHCGDFVPFIETATAEKLPWAATPAVHSFAGFPDESEFPRLIAEFARSRGTAPAANTLSRC